MKQLNKENQIAIDPLERIMEGSSYYQIEMKTYSFVVLGSKLYFYTQSDHLKYIQEYIDSINAGNPDKDVIIRNYALEYQKIPESLIDKMLSQVKTSPGIISELNKIESYLKPLLDAQKRDRKIDNLLNRGVQKNEE